ncbi:MAG: hypothetical protein O2839_05120 [Cyanobacteria bacterium]|nr:hypothetical protein [Cyanobacteriota bacterium]MDA1246613.1 hypothetical protein [Cyanobacteriota bacterium]
MNKAERLRIPAEITAAALVGDLRDRCDGHRQLGSEAEPGAKCPAALG